MSRERSRSPRRRADWIQAPERVYAWSDVQLIVSRTFQKSDYFEVYEGDKRVAWQWCSRVTEHSWRWSVRGCGRYSVKYYCNGGVLFAGDLKQSSDFEVRSPIADFDAPATAVSGQELAVRWRLHARAGARYVVMLQCNGVTLQSIELMPNTRGLAGNGVFATPRAPGCFSLLVRGSSGADSVMLERELMVQFDQRTLADTWVGICEGDAVSKCGVVVPGGSIDVSWNFPLACAGDRLCVVAGAVSAPKVIAHRDVLQGKSINRRAGSVALIAPVDQGLYSVCICAAYRSGSILLLATNCHLAVSSLSRQSASKPEAKGIVDMSPLEKECAPHEAKISLPQCVVCLSSDVDSMMEPCAHAHFCSPCATQVLARTRKCPVCRGSITSVRRIYLGSGV